MIKDMENKGYSKEAKVNHIGIVFCPHCDYGLYEIFSLLKLMKHRKERYVHCPMCGGVIDIDKIKV